MGHPLAHLAVLLAFVVGGGCSDAATPPATAPAKPDSAARCAAGQEQVMLPADPALRRAAKTLAIGAGHSVVAKAGGVAIQIQSLPQAGGGAVPSVERTEYGFDASFGRGCTLYSITLSCDRPGDARCADERYIRGLIAGLSPG